MKEELIPVAYVISNFVAVIMLACSWKYPNISRLLYSALFGWACYANTHAAIQTPHYYLDYAQYALLGFYIKFINGFFAAHITAIVISIAVCQLAIALSLWMRGFLFKMGAVGAIVFLISIAPLGIGSAFPCTLTMAGGLLLLLRKKETGFLIHDLRMRTQTEESTELL
jgi:hypothetical protein